MTPDAAAKLELEALKDGLDDGDGPQLRVGVARLGAQQRLVCVIGSNTGPSKRPPLLGTFESAAVAKGPALHARSRSSCASAGAARLTRARR